MVKDYEKELKSYREITTSNIVVCPYCFKEDEDAWEYNLNDGDSTVATCGECEKEFQIECSISIDYTTTKLDMGDD